MDSIFLEKIVKKRKDSSDHLKVVGIIAGFVVVFFFAISVPFLRMFSLFIIAGAAWGAWWLITGMNREYEYVITDNYIDIDCIVAQRKRFRVFSGDAKEFEICARMDTDLYREYSKGNTKILNYAPTDSREKNYFLVAVNKAKKAKTKGQKVMLIFEPGDKMIPALKKYNPSKIKVDGIFQ